MAEATVHTVVHTVSPSVCAFTVPAGLHRKVNLLKEKKKVAVKQKIRQFFVNQLVSEI